MSDVVAVKRPMVARTAQKTPAVPAALTLGLLGFGVFFWLSQARAAQDAQGGALPPLAVSTATQQGSVAATAQNSGATATLPPTQAFFIPNSGPVTLVPTNPSQSSIPPGIFSTTPITSAPEDRLRERMRAPALIVDLAQADIPRNVALVGIQSSEVRGDGAGPAPGAIGVAVMPPANDRNLSDIERFSARVGSEEVEVAQARRMSGLDRMVPQGAVIGAVMETALNSDLPGFARAVTQRDVYSFDGSVVLIPAGSRLIGQYKSGVAQGASRLFVLWTRLIRADGVSIELASPATDELGRGGIGGKVNRHFFQRYGGAVLTSVLSGGLSAAAASLSGGATILVGSAGQASQLASQASSSSDIPPTITTRQGASIRIFVARDLDFSRVGPVR